MDTNEGWTIKDLYLPRICRNFYYNPDVFLRLVIPNLSRLSSIWCEEEKEEEEEDGRSS